MKRIILFLLVILLVLPGSLAFGGESLSIEPKTILKISDMDAYPTDGIGYKIVNIGDLDNNGVEDLATIAYHSTNDYTKDDDSDSSNKYGAIIILFMGEEGLVVNSKRITLDDKANGLGPNCLGDTTRNSMEDNILARDTQSLESLAYLGNFINNNPTLAIGYPTGDYNGDESNTGDVLLVEISTNGDVNSCTKLTQLAGFSNDGSIEKELSFGFPVLASDVDADEILDLIVGNTGHSMFGKDYGITDLLVFFLDDNGAIKNTIDISGMWLGMTLYDGGLESGSTINGGTNIAVGLGDENGGNDGFFIANIFSDGTLSSSSRIDESTVSYFGFEIDTQQDHPDYGNNPFDSDDDTDGTSDGFGNALESLGDLNDDGINVLVVGSFNDDSPVSDAGSIYFLLLNATTDSPEDIFKLSNNDITSDDSFGHGIASFSDEDTKWLAVGAYLDDTEGTDSGVIYIYDFEDFSFYDSVTLVLPITTDPILPDPNDEDDSGDSENKTDSGTQFLSSTISTSDKVAKIWLRDPENFPNGINYLIVSGYLYGDEIRSYAEFPDWIINYLYEKWYAEEITDDTFYGALQYLLDREIIK